jgi:hypothetical protein
VRLSRLALAALLIPTFLACSTPRRGRLPDLGADDLGPVGVDIPVIDAGPADMNVGDPDLGVDAGTPDLGVDAGTADLGFDAGRSDLGVDAGRPDLGVDAGGPDLGRDAGPAGTGRILISEIATGRGTLADDEFVELYNPSATAYDASGLRVEYASAAGATFSLMAALPAGTTIFGHGYFLLAHATVYTGAASPDATFLVSLSGAGGHVRLIAAGASEVDRCGWGGTALAPEGTPTAGGLTGDQTRERKAYSTSTAASMALGGADELSGNAYDSNDNGADFVVRTIGEPQNSASSEVP